MSETLNNNTNEDKEKPSDLQSLRGELITLAEKGEIKQSVAYIKKPTTAH